MTQTKLAKGITMPCLTVSSLEETKRLFVDLLGLEVKDYDERFNWMELEGEEGKQVETIVPNDTCCDTTMINAASAERLGCKDPFFLSKGMA